MATLLTPGNSTVVAGTTPDLAAELYDNDGTALAKSQITSVTLTIKDCSGAIINSRSNVNVNDNDIGSLADVTVDGVEVVRLTLKPTEGDTAYQGDKREVQSHFWTVEWGWNDGEGVARTSGEIYEIKVERSPTA